MKKSILLTMVMILLAVFGIALAEEMSVSENGDIINPQLDPTWKQMLNSGGDPEVNIFFVVQKDIFPGTTKISRYVFEWAGKSDDLSWETNAKWTKSLYVPNSKLKNGMTAFVKKFFEIGEDRILEDHKTFLVAKENLHVVKDPAGRMILARGHQVNSSAKPILNKKQEEAIETLGAKIIFNDSQMFWVSGKLSLGEALLKIVPSHAFKVSNDNEEGVFNFQSIG